jgi:hypothetical protein
MSSPDWIRGEFGAAFDRLNEELGEGFFHKLRGGRVEIYKFSSASRIKETMEDFLYRNLEKLYRASKNLYSRN